MFISYKKFFAYLLLLVYLYVSERPVNVCGSVGKYKYPLHVLIL